MKTFRSLVKKRQLTAKREYLRIKCFALKIEDVELVSSDHLNKTKQKEQPDFSK